MPLIKNTIPIILAAGKGKRMGTIKNKCLLSIEGKTLLEWTILSLQKAGFKEMVVVSRSTDNDIESLIKRKKLTDVIVAKDPFFLGAGHALFVGTSALKSLNKYDQVLVLYGDDSFLYRPETLNNFAESFSKKQSRLQIMISSRKIVGTIGGLKRDQQGKPVGFYTQPELVELKKEIVEIVCGAFLFNLDWLNNHYYKITKSVANGEFILTSLIQIAHSEGTPAEVFELSKSDEWNGVNTVEDLRKARILKRGQLNSYQ